MIMREDEESKKKKFYEDEDYIRRASEDSDEPPKNKISIEEMISEVKGNLPPRQPINSSIHFIIFSYLKIFFPLLDIIQNNESTIDFTHLLAIMTTAIIAIIINTIINVNAELFRVP